MPELVKSLWLVCIHCEHRAHAPELEKTLWLFCSILVSFPGLHWDKSRVGFRDQPELFSGMPSLVAHV